jgi:hypothetical protein
MSKSVQPISEQSSELTQGPYIVCDKKKNNPRVSIKTCQKKCAFRDECLAFKTITTDMPEGE